MRATSVTVGGGGDEKRRQAAINANPPSRGAVGVYWVLVGGVQVGGLDIQ